VAGNQFRRAGKSGAPIFLCPNKGLTPAVRRRENRCMKTFRHTSAKVCLLLALYLLGARSTINAGAGSAELYNPTLSHNNARLVVQRIADFGTQIALHVYIDDMQVATLPINTGYEALVRPGDHVLSVCTTPNPHGKTRFTHRTVQMHRGETYKFTAMWVDGDWATLQTPSEFVSWHGRIMY
jgi:hypothetical protein